MRVGVTLPFLDKSGNLLDGPGIAERARRIEAADLESVWMADHLPLPGEQGRDRPDPLMYLLISAMATDHVELGTCVYNVPTRPNPYDLAQRFYTLETLAKGRFTLGLGTGSQQREYEAAGLEWDNRFKMMTADMDAIRSVAAGEPIFESPTGQRPQISADPNERTWAQKVGMPRFILGAWHSDTQLKRAVSLYDGWMASAAPGTRFGGWRKVLTEGIERYRELGGTRAVVSSVQIDLKANEPLADDGMFSLYCPPDEARERLQILADLGYDDVILWPADRTNPFGPGVHKADVDLEELELFRTLVPKDTRSPF